MFIGLNGIFEDTFERDYILTEEFAEKNIFYKVPNISIIKTLVISIIIFWEH